jgi:hypothetical protein
MGTARLGRRGTCRRQQGQSQAGDKAAGCPPPRWHNHAAAAVRLRVRCAANAPGSFFCSCLAPWQMVSCAMLAASVLPAAAARGAAAASSPYFCGGQGGDTPGLGTVAKEHAPQRRPTAAGFLRSSSAVSTAPLPHLGECGEARVGGQHCCSCRLVGARSRQLICDLLP